MSIEQIEYWRRQRDKAERGLYNAMVIELSIGCRVIYEDRVGYETTAEVIGHSSYDLILIVRDEKGKEFGIDLSSVTDKEGTE